MIILLRVPGVPGVPGSFRACTWIIKGTCDTVIVLLSAPGLGIWIIKGT